MHAIWNTLVAYYKAHQKHAEYRLKYAGVVGLIGFPLFSVLYTFVMPQPYENFGIRAVAAGLCLVLAAKDFWPANYRKYYLGYSYLVILYCLPFFHTYMVLMNEGNLVFTADSMMALFFTILLVDWRNLLVMYTVGSLAGLAAYFLVTPEIAVPYGYLERIPSFILIIIGGTLFKHSYELIEKEKRKALLALGGEIAHEMRNSLSAMNLSLASIRRAADKPSDIDAAGKQEIQAAVNMGLSTIQSSLNVIDAILKSVADKPIDRSRFVDLSAAYCVQRVLVEYVEQTGQGHHIEADIADDFRFRGDESLFHGVLYNLMKNALYYLPDYPDLRIKIRLHSDGNSNHIEFWDNGPGIAEEVIPRLFSDFSTFGKKDGTGLGLHFCRRVMQAFGGNIVCESIEGEYARFILSFPVLEEETVVQHQLAERSSNVSNLRGKSILVVDDSETNRQFITHYLAKFGARVKYAADGVRAIDAMKQGQYDLVLMDIQMPRLNGLDATRWIRSGCCFSTGQAPNHRIVPIVACSSGDYRSEAVECGMNAYIQKPVEKEELVSKILEQLSPPTEVDFKRVLQGKRVLVVDDIEINRVLIANSLTNIGVEVTQADSGQNALGALMEEAFDLVLMDMQMPDMNGFDATKIIRAMTNDAGEGRKPISEIPVIALTGESDTTGLRNRLYEAGVNDYVLKTGDEKVLMEKLFQWLRYDWTKLISDGESGEGELDDQAPVHQAEASEAIDERAVVSLFLDEAELNFFQLDEAFSNQDIQSFEALSHRLKGMAANIGALRLFDVMKQINDEAKQGRLPCTKDWRSRMEEAYAETKRTLRDGSDQL